MLGGTTGTLVVDAYTGYNAVVDVDGRLRAGCLAHVRRKFFDALSSCPEAQTALDMILDVYRIEHRATELGILRTKAHDAMRDKKSRAAMERGFSGKTGTICPRARWAKPSPTRSTTGSI